MLLAFGAGALIAVSVLVTVYLLRSPAAPSPTGPATPVVAQAPVAPEKPAPALPVLHSPEPVEQGEGASQPALGSPNGSNPSNGPAPVVQAPPPALAQTAAPPAPAENFPPAPTPSLEKLPAMTTPSVAAIPTTSPFIPPTATPASSTGLDPTKPDPKILAYLDALQIAGVRVSDTGSKVLMNDRVFRENEIVDHLLGLRLKKVQSDILTFVDERGVIYTKNL
ncbi:MAG TPA: hypothetical protein VGP21_04835 [Opitutaceae bacterium]|nr:hypothetical protein [Opitutaceae bacterium]